LGVFLFLFAHGASAVTIIMTCQPLSSGSYVLNSDVAAPANSPCFTMMDNNITLNLGGHAVTGVLGKAAITDGGIARRGISVAAGNIAADIGVDLGATTEARVESLNVDAAGVAISVGPYSKVLANVVVTSGTVGISVQCPSLVVWNNAFQGTKPISETGKGCKDVGNTTTK